MKLLEDRIADEGVVIGTDILKVDMFLNHRVDVLLLNEMGKEFHRLFGNDGITLILTVEASGIALAALTAQYFGVPVLFAKKASHKYVGNDLYTAECFSFTHGSLYNLNVSKKYISPGDKVLIIDDFLADGNAANALISIINQSGATLGGVGIAIEKGFQKGGAELRKQGVKLQSLAIIETMSESGITFRD